MNINGKRRRKQKFSLRMTLVIYVIAPLAVSLAVTGYVALTIWERQVETRMQQDLEMVARAIQLPLSDAMERDRTEGIEQALESAFSIDGVYSAYAYDLEGEQIASVGQVDPDPQRSRLTEMVAEGERAGEYGQVGSRRVYSHFVPLSDSRGHASGILQLTRRQKDTEDYIGRVRRHGVAWLGLGVLVMTGLVLLGQNQALGRHFQRLIDGMQRIAAGESDHRIALTGPRDIDSIAGSFNRMLDSIQAAESEIRRNRRKQAALESQLKQAEKLAAIGQLGAGIAHELGSPLSVISGMAQRGLRRATSDSTRTETFDRIQREVERMEVIIRQLLDFSHSRELKPRNLRPEQVVRSAVSAVADEAAGHHVGIALDGDSQAPVFAADPIRLEQALTNLLRNAIQAADHIDVKLAWRVDGDRMVFSVDDSGPGIPEEIRSRLFEPFFTTKNVGAGTGLGLAVVHGIVKEHGGDIRVGSSDMGGAAFEIALPIKSKLSQEEQ